MPNVKDYLDVLKIHQQKPKKDYLNSAMQCLINHYYEGHEGCCMPRLEQPKIVEKFNSFLRDTDQKGLRKIDTSAHQYKALRQLIFFYLDNIELGQEKKAFPIKLNSDLASLFYAFIAFFSQTSGVLEEFGTQDQLRKEPETNLKSYWTANWTASCRYKAMVLEYNIRSGRPESFLYPSSPSQESGRIYLDESTIAHAQSRVADTTRAIKSATTALTHTTEKFKDGGRKKETKAAPITSHGILANPDFLPTMMKTFPSSATKTHLCIEVDRSNSAPDGAASLAALSQAVAQQALAAHVNFRAESCRVSASEMIAALRAEAEAEAVQNPKLYRGHVRIASRRAFVIVTCFLKYMQNDPTLSFAGFLSQVGTPDALSDDPAASNNVYKIGQYCLAVLIDSINFLKIHPLVPTNIKGNAEEAEMILQHLMPKVSSKAPSYFSETVETIPTTRTAKPLSDKNFNISTSGSLRSKVKDGVNSITAPFQRRHHATMDTTDDLEEHLLRVSEA